MATMTPTTSAIGQGGVFAGKTVSGSLIPLVWSSKILKTFFEHTVYQDVCNTEYEADIKGYGDQVIIRKQPKVTVSPYVIGAGLTAEVPDPDIVTLPIDQAASFTVAVNDVIRAQSDLNLLSEYSASAAEYVKQYVNEIVLTGASSAAPGIFAGADAANIGATAGAVSAAYNLGTAAAPVTLTTANVLQVILSMASVLDEQKIPNEDRFLIIDPATRFLLLQSNLQQAQITGDGVSPVRNGLIGTIDRFKTYLSLSMPAQSAGSDFWGGTSAGAVKQRVLIAGHKSAAAFAAQVREVETLKNPNDFGDILRGLIVFGRKVIRPEGLTIARVA